MSQTAPPTTPPAQPEGPQKPRRARKAKVQGPVPPSAGNALVPAKTSRLAPIDQLVNKIHKASEAKDLAPRAQRQQLEEMESYIAFGLASYYTTGLALARIRDAKLYKVDEMYGSWTDYVQDRWDLGGETRANQIIDAAQIVDDLQKVFAEQGKSVIPLPTVESHARELKRLKTVEDMASVWEEAVETAPEKPGKKRHITAGFVEGLVQKKLGFLPPPASSPEGTNPQPPTTSDPPPAQGVETETKPQDQEPADAGAPPPGQEPDTLGSRVPSMEEEETKVKSNGEVVVLTPALLLERVIEALKKGYFSHKDPQIVGYVAEAATGLRAWEDAFTDAVAWNEDGLIAGEVDDPEGDGEEGPTDDAEALQREADAEIERELKKRNGARAD